MPVTTILSILNQAFLALKISFYPKTTLTVFHWGNIFFFPFFLFLLILLLCSLLCVSSKKGKEKPDKKKIKNCSREKRSKDTIKAPYFLTWFSIKRTFIENWSKKKYYLFSLYFVDQNTTSISFTVDHSSKQSEFKLCWANSWEFNTGQKCCSMFSIILTLKIEKTTYLSPWSIVYI